MRYLDWSIKSVIELTGASRSTRRSATVTISVPEAASASAMTSGLENLPVPMIRRELKVRPPSVSRSVKMWFLTYRWECSLFCFHVAFPGLRMASAGESLRALALRACAALEFEVCFIYSHDGGS